MKGAISREEAEELFKNYKDYIYRSAFFLTQSRELAEDITQEVFIKVIVYYHTYNEHKPIQPWLYKIMLNVTHTTMKKQRYGFTLETIFNTPSKDNVEMSILDNEMNQELWYVISKLPLKMKEVLYMHYYLEMKLETIAEVLEIPVGTCKSRLNTGLNKLRKNKSIPILNYRRERQIE